MNEYIIVLIDTQTDLKYFQNFRDFREMRSHYDHLVRMANLFCRKTRREIENTVTEYTMSNFLRESYVELTLVCGENVRLRNAFHIPLNEVNQ